MQLLRTLIAACSLLLTTSAFATSDKDAIATSVEWRRLLHFSDHAPAFGSDRSRADSPVFFVHRQGRTSPRAELDAFLNALYHPEVPTGTAQGPAACTFPARTAFLRRFFPDLPPTPNHLVCKDLEEWRRGLGAARATLIFASSYPNNPASMFGHTLLRLDPEAPSLGADKPPHDLLSYVIHFSAQTDDEDNPLQYMAKGLFGGYPGRYLIAPYYEMVNIYSGLESRDLWEFTLTLSPGGMDRLQMHLWELLHNAWFDYWFVDENCSYQLLALLDVAEPAWALTSTQGPWVLPVDTIRSVLRSVPGSSHNLPYRRISLREKTLGILAANQSNPDNLDAAIARLIFWKMKGKGKLPPKDDEQLRVLLMRRSETSTASPASTSSAPSPPPDPVAPSEGHKTRAAWAGGGTIAGTRGLILGIKGGMHSLSDHPDGYAGGSSINFISGEIHIPTQVLSPRPKALKFSLLEVTSLTPYKSIDPQWSWRAAFDGKRVFRCDETCSHSWENGVEGMAGVTWGTPGQDLLVWMLTGVRLALKRAPMLSPAVKSGLSWNAPFTTSQFYLPRLVLQGQWLIDSQRKDRMQTLEAELNWNFHVDLSGMLFWTKDTVQTQTGREDSHQNGIKLTKYF